MKKSSAPSSKIPLILRFHRLMDVFAKSDDERDFYLDRVEGFLLYVDLDKGIEELDALEKEFLKNPERYAPIPKMTFYEIKKVMEGFIQEKVYDIDTKEKLVDIVSSKEPRVHFLEFVYDHLGELEKWQSYYQERSRIRIIEWLRQCSIHFVFEEDLELPKNTVEKVKRSLFDPKVARDISAARDLIFEKSKSYYSSEALNPRPKRGRPPKQVAKVELEPQISADIYTQVPSVCRPFLYIPDITSSSSVTFSAQFDTEEHLLASLRGSPRLRVDEKLEALSERLESLRHLSSRLANAEPFFDNMKGKKPFDFKPKPKEIKVTPIIEKESPKMGSAVESVLPKKRGRPRKEDEPEEFTPQGRRRFAIKKVAQIKRKKKKSR